MRLAAFIRANVGQISVEWERFAATLMPKEEFSASVLRDGIAEILAEIASNMDSAQSANDQQEKSEGIRPRFQPSSLAAEEHAIARIKMGLSARQLASEFRALRATVIRLWQQQGLVEFGEVALYDLTRFNEAIDETLAESAEIYTDKIQNSRDLFLGILTHDLRSPLAAISASAEMLSDAETLDRNAYYAVQMLVSTKRMAHLITDLTELTRVRLGPGIPINRTPTSIRHICTNVLNEMKAIYPKRIFELNCDDEFPGEWDEGRLSQVLSNLGNAVQHGAIESPITLTAKSDRTGVEIDVHNEDNPIPQDMLRKLFDPFIRGGASEGTDDQYSTSLGLGLYIAKEIILAHGGTIEVQSSADKGTTFAVRLPAAASGAAGEHPRP